MSYPTFPTPQPYAGPAGAASMAAPLQPSPPPAPPAPTAAPFPGEQFAPGELAYYHYQHPLDPAGKLRVQLVSVAHVTADHVHAIVLGDVRDMAQFAHGQLTHGFPASA